MAKIKIVLIFEREKAKIVKRYNSGFVNRNSGFDSRSWLSEKTGMEIILPVFFIFISL